MIASICWNCSIASLNRPCASLNVPFTQTVSVHAPVWACQTTEPAVKGQSRVTCNAGQDTGSGPHARRLFANGRALGTPDGDWVSMAIASDGSHYGVPEGIVAGFPVTCADGDFTVIEGLEINDFSRERIDPVKSALSVQAKNCSEITGWVPGTR